MSDERGTIGPTDLIEVTPELRELLLRVAPPAASWKRIPERVLADMLTRHPERERRRLAAELREFAEGVATAGERNLLVRIADGLALLGGVNAAAEAALAADRVGKRHAAHREARAYVRGEWPQARDSYAGNRSAFARDMAKRLKRERGLEVTERTIAEDWLKGL